MDTVLVNSLKIFTPQTVYVYSGLPIEYSLTLIQRYKTPNFQGLIFSSRNALIVTKLIKHSVKTLNTFNVRNHYL